MISVYYRYKVKSGVWKAGNTDFDSCYSALRFIKKLKKSEEYIYLYYVCDDSEDNEYLWRKV